MKKTFELIFTKEFLKRLKRIDKQTQLRILKELKILKENPAAGKQLVGQLSDLKSFRTGDYRIIYQLSKKEITILTVGHRKKVYHK
ncbi:MAG: type II toxin-antitoxin system RelE/ParE family toxin [Candidatus Bathyarchaeota archaeon]|nr:type II toxin-antitoxin system RelE/ParE family toxin [Candidatus Bathyarchaeota archaeon]